MGLKIKPVVDYGGMTEKRQDDVLTGGIKAFFILIGVMIT